MEGRISRTQAWVPTDLTGAVPVGALKALISPACRVELRHFSVDSGCYDGRGAQLIFPEIRWERDLLFAVRIAERFGLRRHAVVGRSCGIFWPNPFRRT